MISEVYVLLEWTDHHAVRVLGVFTRRADADAELPKDRARRRVVAAPMNAGTRALSPLTSPLRPR